jgi:hypothetical protein
MHISSDDAAFVLGKVRDVPTAREAEQAPGVGGAAAARRAAPRRVSQTSSSNPNCRALHLLSACCHAP